MTSVTLFHRFVKAFGAPLVPWVGTAALLAATLAGVHYVKVAFAQERLVALEAEWAAARNGMARRLEAKQVRKDLAHVLAALPSQRDFARFPLNIWEIAKRNGVMLPALAYNLEKTSEGLATKAVLQGAVTGHYEDLRRFIHHLEVSDRMLLFVEDLSVGRSAEEQTEKKGKLVTVNLRIATYIREDGQTGHVLKASVE